MRSLDDLRFIASRVIEHCRANPPSGPLLGESEPQPAPATCKRGHTAMVQQKRQRVCGECEKLGKAARRAGMGSHGV